MTRMHNSEWLKWALEKAQTMNIVRGTLAESGFDSSSIVIISCASNGPGIIKLEGEMLPSDRSSLICQRLIGLDPVREAQGILGPLAPWWREPTINRFKLEGRNAPVPAHHLLVLQHLNRLYGMLQVAQVVNEPETFEFTRVVLQRLHWLIDNGNNEHRKLIM